MVNRAITAMKEIRKKAEEKGPVNCVIAGAYRESEVEAALRAKDSGMINPIFIGDEELYKRFSDISKSDLIPEMDPIKAAVKAVKLCYDGDGDILLKGSVSTSQFLKPVLDSQYGLKEAPLLSHIALLEIPALKRLIAITDGGMCISPDLYEKFTILQNAVNFMNSIGIKKPHVGILSAIETVNPLIENSVDAAILTKAAERGQISGCIVEGPLAFDLMVSEYACGIKEVKGPACGDVDLILVPDITCGNSVAKALIHLADAEAAGTILGTKKPVVMLSRADKVETKLNSIALGVLLK